MPSVALSKDGPPLVLHGAYGEVLTGASPSEQSAWKELRAQLLRYAGILKPFLSRRPPDLAGMSLLETAALGQTALALKKLGKEDMRDFLRVLLMNVADLLDEQLADVRLKGLLAFDATLGSHLGPRSPTSLLGLYYRLAGETGGAAGAQILPQGRHGRSRRRHPRRGGKGRRHHPHGHSGGEDHCRERPRRRRRARQWRGAAREHNRLRHQSGDHLPRPCRAARDRHRLRAQGEEHPHEGRCGQAQSGARPAAAIHRRRCRRPQGPAGHRAVARSRRARLQPVQIWRVLARAGDGDHAAQPCRPVARTQRRLRAVGGRAIRALRAERRLGCRQAEIPEGDHGAARSLCAWHRQERGPCRAFDAGRYRDAATACRAAIGTTANCRPTRC